MKRSFVYMFMVTILAMANSVAMAQVDTVNPFMKPPEPEPQAKTLPTSSVPAPIVSLSASAPQPILDDANMAKLLGAVDSVSVVATHGDMAVLRTESRVFYVSNGDRVTIEEQVFKVKIKGTKVILSTPGDVELFAAQVGSGMLPKEFKEEDGDVNTTGGTDSESGSASSSSSSE